MATYEKVQFIAFNIKPGTRLERTDSCPDCACKLFTPDDHCIKCNHTHLSRTAACPDCACGKFEPGPNKNFCKTCNHRHLVRRDACPDCKCATFEGRIDGGQRCTGCGHFHLVRENPCFQCNCNQTNCNVFTPDPVDRQRCAACGHYHPKRVYLGELTASRDIQYRCRIMKKAIETAYYKVKDLRGKPGFFAQLVALLARKRTNTIDSPKTLSVFMAPEFFFRPAGGGYPLEEISSIMDSLRKETDTDSYKNWLFVFGTAISGLKKNETTVKILTAKRTPPTTTVTVDSLLESYWTSCEAREFGDFQSSTDDAKKLQGPVNVKTHLRGINTTIKAIQLDSANRFKITLDTSEPCDTKQTVVFYRPGHTCTKEFAILNSQPSPNGTVITIDNPDQHTHDPCPECRGGPPCEKLEPVSLDSPICRKCGHTHSQNAANFIRRNQLARVDTLLELETSSGFDAEHFVSLTTRADRTEVGNYALVAKGGPPDDSNGPKHYVIYKEHISWVDFLGPNYYQPKWGAPDGSGRGIQIQPQSGKKPTESTALPNEGSRDILSEKKNRPGTVATYQDRAGTRKEHPISEINKVGYGGGSVFTLDGITFGLEVCLDHAKNRLYDFYNGAGAQPGDPKVQIHLIPSCGMSIGGGKVACIKGGLIFNVDGQAGSALRLNDETYSCDEHPDQHSKTEIDCPGGHAQLQRLKQIGRIVKPVPNGMADVTDKDITVFFEKAGQIIVYKEQKIPKAESVK